MSALLRVLLCIVLMWSRSSAAEQHQVVYVTSAAEQAAAAERLLRAELSASEFEVVAAEQPGPLDDALLERVTRERPRVIASVAIVPDGEDLGALVWLTDRETEQGTLREVSVAGHGEAAARLLALRVVELLHARALELSPRDGSDEPEAASPDPLVTETPPTLKPVEPPQSSAASSSPEASAERPAGPRRPAADPGPSAGPTRRRRWSIGAGVGVVGGPGAMPVGVAPLAVLAFNFTRSWAAELVAAGPAIGTVAAASGTATVDQELIAVRSRLSLPERPLAPHVSLGVGGYRLGARGDAQGASYAGRSDETFAFLALLGLGLRWHATPELRVLVDLSGAFVMPRPTLRFAARTVAATGAPLAVGAAAMELAW